MRIEPIQAANTYKRAISEGLIDQYDTTLHFISKEVLLDRLENVRLAFPKEAMHTVAIKANPLTEVLKEITAQGFGLEAASFEEVIHAHSIGCQTIGWDSPAKTDEELEKCLSTLPHVIVNCDSLSEAEHSVNQNSENLLLLRINPQLKGSAHPSMTVGGIRSKFGEPISNRDQIIRSLVMHEGILGLHVHTSSQTDNISELVAAVRSIIDLALEINKSRNSPLTHINIGGGFPVSYTGTIDLNIAEYAQMLKQDCPELFNGKFTLITEFGRYYHAYAGFSLTQVAQVKQFFNHQVIIGHAGADLFLRESYQPGQWPHRISLLNSNGFIAEGQLIQTDIAGPLCFGGDYIQKNFSFYKARKGDWVCVLDSGANSIALWSKHCSRAFPKCILFSSDEIRTIRPRDTIERSLAFWS